MRPGLTPDSSVDDVIAAVMPSADRRELRAAFSHIAAELGTRRVRAVRARHVDALLDGLRRAGLSAGRQDAVVDALHSLFAFAVARGLVAVDPTRDLGPSPQAPEPAPEVSRTPTLTMVALGARVAVWTTAILTLGFAALLLVLVVELA
jgi:site-specific recombinase XerC